MNGVFEYQDKSLVSYLYSIVEDFCEGQGNVNQVRKNFDLPEIPTRARNVFFQRDNFLDYIEGRSKIEEEINISSPRDMHH